MHNDSLRQKLDADGFAITGRLYSDETIEAILLEIEKADTSGTNFKRSGGLFAVRAFLQSFPQLRSLLFNPALKALVESQFGPGYFVVKSIYFDKPEDSNWFVSYHQDLTVAVSSKADVEGYGPWTVKGTGFGVQPPLSVLQNNFTVRIHLDRTDKNNGALKVVKGSHLKGILRPQSIDLAMEEETSCEVDKGHAMLMRPLLLHASDRTNNGCKRRVIHLEFSNTELPSPLQWAEKEVVEDKVL